jgi:hypothetical protein
MWLVTAVVGLLALLLPGAARAHLAWTLALALFALGWGAASVFMGLTGRTMPIGRRAVVTATMMPVVAVALWATGGVNSFLQPVMFFTALFIGYFFEPRYAWPLIALFVFAYASPLLYDARTRPSPGRCRLPTPPTRSSSSGSPISACSSASATHGAACAPESPDPARS